MVINSLKVSIWVTKVSSRQFDSMLYGLLPLKKGPREYYYYYYCCCCCCCCCCCLDNGIQWKCQKNGAPNLGGGGSVWGIGSRIQYNYFYVVAGIISTYNLGFSDHYCKNVIGLAAVFYMSETSMFQCGFALYGKRNNVYFLITRVRVALQLWSSSSPIQTRSK